MSEARVPVYQQTAEFSCGAACLVMALAALGDMQVSRSTEFALWREATVIGVRGIDQWGLAVPAARRGVAATVVSPVTHMFPRIEPDQYDAFMGSIARRFPEGETPRITKEDLDLVAFAQTENMARARAAGVSWLEREPDKDDVRSAVEAGAYPVLLVDLERIGGSFSVLHWVVVVAADEDGVTVHDPDDEGPGVRELDWDRVMDAMDVSGWGAPRAMVVLGDWPEGAEGEA